MGMTIIYTDGACRDRLKVKDNIFASWAFVVVERENKREHVKGEVRFWQSGYVEISKRSIDYIEARKTTNQTAELSAVYWACAYLRKNKVAKATIFTDSLYSVNVITGEYQIKAHKQMIRTIRNIHSSRYELCWIKGHVGHQFNELADSLAKAQLND